MKISVIVPTHNRPRALRLCLLSLAEQSIAPYEVLIADDGSGRDTRDLILEMQKELKYAFSIKHIWQDCNGRRWPRILNETVRHSAGEYLIFLDGHCMAHRNFVRAHVEKSDPNSVLSGKRVEIGKELSDWLLANGRILNAGTLRLFYDALTGQSRRFEEAIQIRSKLLRRLMHRDNIHFTGVWGCNFSLYKKLFLAVNGCDESLLENSIGDNDIGIRALNLGKSLISVRGLAIVFHLWHPSDQDLNDAQHLHYRNIIKKRIVNKETICANGIRKL